MAAARRGTRAVRNTPDDARMPLVGPPDPLRLLRIAQTASGAIAHRLRADHTTLNHRSLRSYSGTTVHAYLHAAVAPSRRIRPIGGDVMADLAASMAASLDLPPTPTTAGADGQRFEVKDDGSPTRTLFITSSGVLEMLWALQQSPTEDAAWSVSALDACAALARFVTLVQGASYGSMIRSSRWRKLVDPRVDWCIGVTPTAKTENGPRGWRDILLVGEQPDRATDHAYGFMPPAGYGAQRLHNVQRSLSSEVILQTLLTEWLQVNGYLRTGAAVERTIAAALRAPQAP